MIECLKRSGLEIKEIKQFMAWCAQGSETYPQRHALFVQQAERVEAEIERLQKSLDMIRFKCWYYEQRGPRARHAAGPSAAGHPANL